MSSLVLLFLATPQAHAQRYLTEFVGTAKVAATTGVAAVNTQLSFSTQVSRSLTGDFSLVEVDAFGSVETELFSVDATLASSGQCPARVSSTTTSSTGHLYLDEYTFDTNAFALYGKIDLDSDLGAVRLSTSRLRGPLAFLNPPADFLDLPSTSALLTLSGATGDEELELVLDKVDVNGAATGDAFTVKGETPYSVVLSANTRWMYLVATGEASLIVGRGAVTLDGAGLPVYATGDFSELTDTGKTLDKGTFVIDLR